MAEECKVCIKEEALKYMVERIENGETSTKDILKVVSEIKEGHSATKYSLLTIENTQALQAERDRENKDLFMTQFRAISDENTARKLRIAAEKKEAAKVAVIAEAELKKERRATRNAMYIAIVVVLANTLIGIAVKFGS